MNDKTKAILKHLSLALLCVAAGVGACFLTRLVGEKLVGILYIVAVGCAFEAFLQLRMLFSSARVHCRACGTLAALDRYEILEQKMAEDGKHVSSEKIRLYMRCPACGETFTLEKTFSVAKYSTRRQAWRVTDVDKAVRDYAAGKLWF